MLLSFVFIMTSMNVFAQEEGEDARTRDYERFMEKDRDRLDQALEDLQKKLQSEEFKQQLEMTARKAQDQARELELQARALHFGNQNSTQLMLSKEYDGTSGENTGEFQIEESVRQIRFSIDGSVEEGSIVIKLLLPEGKIFKELTIDNTADIRFSQSLVIREEENKYSGRWKYVIKANKTTGRYRLSINTN